MSDALIDSLRRAVEAAPDDVALRVHLAGLLVEAGHVEEAVHHAAAALQRDPSDSGAQRVMARAMATPPTAPADSRAPSGQSEGFDWRQAEAELGDVVPPMFVDGGVASAEPAFEVERSGPKLADVGGMTPVKERLEAAFLVPLRNPELRKAFGKSLRGGLLLYGPPGCGKTFLARAVAGEMGAGFINVALNDVLDMYLGQSERNLHEIFELARRSAPCVIFLDEIDALGQKRSQLRTSALRSSVNQLLTELDGVSQDNEGVFVLAATNAPWDLDPALKRPGRLDRTIFVPPPDRDARAAILAFHLRERPIAGVDLQALARQTEGCSGADLAHVCEAAAERALLDSARTGEVRLIQQQDLLAGVTDVRPSIAAWLESARNVVMFANSGGEYDELARYIKKGRAR
jgi:SpoVK/Ycf46/Vps4 family AAA+-type ATPase